MQMTDRIILATLTASLLTLSGVLLIQSVDQATASKVHLKKVHFEQRHRYRSLAQNHTFKKAVQTIVQHCYVSLDVPGETGYIYC